MLTKPIKIAIPERMVPLHPYRGSNQCSMEKAGNLFERTGFRLLAEH